MLFLSVFSTGIISSCQDELVSENERFMDDQSCLERVKVWYAEQKQGEEVMLSSLARSGGELLFYTEPSWNYFCESENENCLAIDVALTDRIALDFVLESNKKKYEETGEHRYRRSYSRLVILTSKATGSKTGFIMTLLPSVKYVERNNQVENNLYLYRDPNYDGMVFYHDLNGLFVNGWRYERGEVTGRVQSLETTSNSEKSGDETFNYEIMPMTYSVTGYATARMGGEGGGSGIIDGGNLSEVVVPGKKPGGNTGGSGVIIIIGGNGGYDGDHDSGLGGSTGGSVGGGSSSGSSSTSSSETPKIEIDTSLTNNPRVNKIFEALGKDAWSYFNKLLSRYEGQINKLDLIIKLDAEKFVGKNYNLNGLCAMKASYVNGILTQGSAIIYINVDRLDDRSALEIGRTFLHESLHAYIHAYGSVENPSYGETSLDMAWEDYVRGSDQHEEMAIREVNNIAQELERLHKQTSDYNKIWGMDENKGYVESDRKLFYERLAWEGLEKTAAYQRLDAGKREKMEEMRKIKFLCSRDWE